MADGSANGITLNANGVPTNAAAMMRSDHFRGRDPSDRHRGRLPSQAGTDSDQRAVQSVLPLNSSLVVAPAERPDILVDFSLHAGQSIILYTDAPAPFPSVIRSTTTFQASQQQGNPVNALRLPGLDPIRAC